MIVSMENSHEMIKGAAFAAPRLRALNTATTKFKTTKTETTKTKTTV